MVRPHPPAPAPQARRGSLRWLPCLAALAAATSAHAQSGNAQAQFDYGLAEMEAGRYASGCPALAESFRLDPLPGVLFTLAECENKQGRIASAVAHYDAYLDQFARMSDDQKARQRGRDKVASAQRDVLKKDVPKLSIALPASAPPGTSVTRDGEPLGAPSMGVALPVDPGDHVVVAHTPDGIAHENRVTIARGEERTLVLDLSAATAPRAASVPALASAPVPAPALAAAPARTSTWIALAVGAAGIAVGSITGAMVLGDKSTIDAHCAGTQCDAQGLEAADHSRTFGTISTASFVVGGVAFAAAAVLYLTAPRSAPRTAGLAW